MKKSDLLSKRLFALAEKIPPGCTVCDVGSDHGYLPAYLLNSGVSPEVWVTDINPLPLERAKTLFFRENIASRARFFLCDGVPEEKNLPDVFVIAGMGGETIEKILQAALLRLAPGTRFFLQPMTKEEILRRFLRRSGFAVEEEKIVSENGKIFVLLFTVFDGIRREADAVSDFLGEEKFDRDPDRFLYYQKLKKRLQTRILGLEKAGLNADSEKKLQVCLEVRMGGMKRENS